MSEKNRMVTFELPYSENHIDTQRVVKELDDAAAWLRGQRQYNSANVIARASYAITGPDIPLAADRDPDLWHVQVSVTRPAENGWSAQRTLPTFTIDGAVHGIDTHRGAAACAADVLCVDLNSSWTYLAAVRNGGDDMVYTFNLHNLGASLVGDHTFDLDGA